MRVTFYKTKRNAYKACAKAKEGTLRALQGKRARWYRVKYLEERGWYIKTSQPAGAILPGGIWLPAAIFAALEEK